MTTALHRPVYLWSQRRWVRLPLVDLGKRIHTPPIDPTPLLADEPDLRRSTDYAGQIEIDRRVIAFLRDHPGSTREQVAAGTGYAATNTFLLDSLAEIGQHDGALPRRWTLRPDWDADL
jgi:hypothetical protein